MYILPERQGQERGGNGRCIRLGSTRKITQSVNRAQRLCKKRKCCRVYLHRPIHTKHLICSQVVKRKGCAPGDVTLVQDEDVLDTWFSSHRLIHRPVHTVQSLVVCLCV